MNRRIKNKLKKRLGFKHYKGYNIIRSYINQAYSRDAELMFNKIRKDMTKHLEIKCQCVLSESFLPPTSASISDNNSIRHYIDSYEQRKQLISSRMGIPISNEINILTKGCL